MENIPPFVLLFGHILIVVFVYAIIASTRDAFEESAKENWAMFALFWPITVPLWIVYKLLSVFGRMLMHLADNIDFDL